MPHRMNSLERMIRKRKMKPGEENEDERKAVIQARIELNDLKDSLDNGEFRKRLNDLLRRYAEISEEPED